MKVLEKYWKTIMVAFMATLALIAVPTIGSASSSSLTIISPSDAYDQTGRTYGELSAAWWKHVFEIPSDNNPLLDPTGANCNFGQQGSVFFLASTFGGNVVRNDCRVPAGKILFLPLLATAVSREIGEHVNERGARNYCNGFIRSTKVLQLNIDGTDAGTIVNLVPHTTPWRAVSPDGFFLITAPENNIFGGVPGDSYEFVTDGFYVMIAPLSPGPHTITFGGSSRNFASYATYNLIVEEP